MFDGLAAAVHLLLHLTRQFTRKYGLLGDAENVSLTVPCCCSRRMGRGFQRRSEVDRRLEAMVGGERKAEGDEQQHSCKDVAIVQSV